LLNECEAPARAGAFAFSRSCTPKTVEQPAFGPGPHRQLREGGCRPPASRLQPYRVPQFMKTMPDIVAIRSEHFRSNRDD
jgi:hypothetical protein